MAWLFQLAAEFGPNEGAAKDFASHFAGERWRLCDGTHVSADGPEISPSKDELGNYWAYICPSGVSRSGASDPKDSQQFYELALLLYERLRGINSFRYAIAGVEVEQFAIEPDLPGLMNHPAISGLVLSRQLWLQFGEPDGFEDFSQNYLWRPITQAGFSAR